MTKRGFPTAGGSDDEIRNLIRMMGEGFKANAPVSAAQAATIILDGVRNDEWRILVGDDAYRLDESVRGDPRNAYGAAGASIPTVPFGR
jgi:hypothetical protein